tara:strand:+ start:102 stop:389 length:288 start_codon:yes stop_codon:yes gene_type:complete
MKAQDFLNDRSDHHVKFLFKSYLLILEDLKKTHEINFNKLYDELPKEYHSLINIADYFDEDYYQNYRKKVLDIGNSVLRDYNSELENLVVEFKFK